MDSRRLIKVWTNKQCLEEPPAHTHVGYVDRVDGTSAGLLRVCVVDTSGSVHTYADLRYIQQIPLES